jgi:hypothetical protein
VEGGLVGGFSQLQRAAEGQAGRDGTSWPAGGGSGREDDPRRASRSETPASSRTRRKPTPTVQEAAERWLATYSHLGQLRISTQALYRHNLRAYAFPRFGARLVTALTREDIRDLVADLVGQGRSRSLVRNVVAPIRQTFNQLIEDGVVAAIGPRASAAI